MLKEIRYLAREKKVLKSVGYLIGLSLIGSLFRIKLVGFEIGDNVKKEETYTKIHLEHSVYTFYSSLESFPLPFLPLASPLKNVAKKLPRKKKPKFL